MARVLGFGGLMTLARSPNPPRHATGTAARVSTAALFRPGARAAVTVPRPGPGNCQPESRCQLDFAGTSASVPASVPWIPGARAGLRHAGKWQVLSKLSAIHSFHVRSRLKSAPKPAFNFFVFSQCVPMRELVRLLSNTRIHMAD